jgi:hypothetical protein
MFLPRYHPDVVGPPAHDQEAEYAIDVARDDTAANAI